MTLLTTVFALMPDLPPTPQMLLDFSDELANLLETSIQYIRYVLSPLLTFVVLVVVSAVFMGEHLYHAIMWILRKIPILGIK